MSFPEAYKSDPRTNIIVINGERVSMTPEQEEMAVAWSKKIGTPYVEDPVFQENFLYDFLKLFPPRFKHVKIKDIIFPTLPEKVELTKEQKKSIAAGRKKKRLELKEKFGYAIVDGIRTEIANWVVEPPGLFMGRGCVSEDTLVKTIGGSKYVRELSIDDLIATHTGSENMFYKPVSSIAKQGIRPVFLLRTRTHSIRATANHPFLSLRAQKVARRNQDGTFSNRRYPATLSWVPLSKLKRGDYVVSVKRYQTPGSGKQSNTATRMFNDMIISQKSARLFGYYLGDGFLHKRQNVTRSGISFSDGHWNLSQEYTKICEDVFGIIPNVSKQSGGNSLVLQVVPGEFARVFERMGITGTALTKRVPDWFFSLADDLKCMFLRGYLDADGHFSVNRIGDVEYASFSFESPNRRLIEDLRELAISAGLQVSNLSFRLRHGFANNSHYRFFINDHVSILRLLDHKEQLDGQRTRNHSLGSRSNSLRSTWDWSRLRMLDSELFGLERILEISESGRAETYDISMSDKRQPNYIADGFVVHNSHPMRGHWKPRITEEDITLNIDKNATVPPGKWKVIHAPDNMWIACWTDKLSGKVKYVWLHDSSSIRQMRDKSKYDKAKLLETNIQKVRSYIDKSMSSKDPKTRRIATACFLIDKLALRVGDEKDEDEADTVGASTLRVEHLKFRENAIEFDFFGKDYVRWQKTLEIASEDRAALENLKEFCNGKKPDDLIFDGITSRNVNEFFGKASSGLTAKVFRTFHATTVVKSYLGKHDKFSKEALTFDKLYQAKMANLEAAIRANHKRTPPKTFEQSLQKREEKLKELERVQPKTDKQKEKLRERIEKMKKQIELAKTTRDYNLNTSLRNYIDPRVYKKWADKVGLDWKLLYTGTLQRKMAWVDSSNAAETANAMPVTVKVD